MSMGVRMAGVGKRGGGLVSSGGNVSVTDGGADSVRATWGDCCRFPDGIFGELWEDLPYHLPFTFHTGDFFLNEQLFHEQLQLHEQ